MKVKAYKLRSQGVRIADKEAIRATETQGNLFVVRRGSGTETAARFLDDAGKQIWHEIDGPCVEIKGDGIMVHGSNVIMRSDGPARVRQAWWCIPVI